MACGAAWSLAACAGTGSGGAGNGTVGVHEVPGPMSVRIEQYREDEVAGVMQVGVTNHGDGLVAIESVRIDWSGLAEPVAADLDYRLPAEASVDLPVPVGLAQCPSPYTGDPRSPQEPAQVTVGLAGGATVQTAVVDSSALARIYQAECRRRYLSDQVNLSFGDAWTLAGDASQTRAVGTMRLRRGDAAGPVAVTGVDGSVLLDLAVTGQPLPVVLADQLAEVVVPVEVRSTLRCDGHALGESKQTFAFDVMVDLGQDGQALPFALTPDHDGRARMQEVIDAACG